jgi:hypothetical protein
MTAPICATSLATGPSRSRRAISEACSVAVVAIGAFEHRLRQLLDEQRHAVGALDDLVDNLLGETGIASEALDQRRAIAFPKAVQRQDRHLWLSAPGVLEFGPEGDDEQDMQPRDPIKYQI